ncbi:galectin 17 [Centroberyx affinis]|uniref:galectin 17 n=1 Tax=Centroberyx affinis TaxID=166261 RepID=UPI003A5C3EE3
MVVLLLPVFSNNTYLTRLPDASESDCAADLIASRIPINLSNTLSRPSLEEEDSTMFPSAAMNMYNAQSRYRCFVHLHFILMVSLVDSSPLTVSTTPVSISSVVGGQAVLPCSWKSRLAGTAPPDCHVQWQTPDDTVYEGKGEQVWQAQEFRDRAEVVPESLKAGDCSLIVNDVQFGDTGLYESFMVVEGARLNTRVFIQSVRLSVYDHKSRQSHGPGDDMVLELHTPRSVRVVFQSRNSSEWSVLWMRGDENTQRLEKLPDKEQLALKKVTRADEGTYKVLDEHGLAVSTVQLSVDEGSTARRQQQIQESQVLVDDTRNSCSSLRILFSLVISSLILHLL